MRAGLVTRAADPHDGRAGVLLMTPEGHAALDDITGWYSGHLAAALDEWIDEEISALAAMLRRFSDDLLTRFADRHDGPITRRNSHNLEAAR